jgi:TetR/AcrR family transcriptional regulator, transcriptional repressor for nem operon
MARQREFDKDEVINRAMLLFWEQGYEATSIRDLIETMGISSSSMYEAFGDKRGVFLAALARFCEQERAQIAQMARDIPSPDEFVARLFGSIDDAVQPASRAQGSLAFNAMVEYGTRDPNITELLLGHYFGIAAIIADVIRQGQLSGTVMSQQDPLHLAYTILSALHGVATVKGVKPDFVHAQAIAQLVVKLLQI